MNAANRESETGRDGWQTILRWRDADPLLQQRFRQQLVMLTGWSAQDCSAAIDEYLKFCWLAAHRQGAVSPSEEIDKVWHLHLTYTRDYWDDFCPNRLGMTLHHCPALGRPGEAQSLRSRYAETLHAYAERFGEPSARWWPSPRRDAVRPAIWRRWLRPLNAARAAGVAIALLPLSAIAQSRPLNPLDWQGGDFLMLYAALLLIALIGGGVYRAFRTRSGDTRGSMATEPGVWSLAFLAGGPERVTDSAVAELHRTGAIEWDESSRSLRVTGVEPPTDPVLRAVHANAGSSGFSAARIGGASAIQSLRVDAERRGWWFTREEATAIVRAQVLPLLALSGFAAAKIAVGLSRDKPVVFLVILTVLTLVCALVVWLSRPKITAAGRALLAAQKSKHKLEVRAHRDAHVALAVALGGTAVLSGTALAGYHSFRQPPSSGDSSSDSSSSDSGGDGGGGGGCGGCGGD